MEQAPEWPVVDSTEHWQTPYFTGRIDRVRRPSGDVGEYYYLDLDDGVSVVALDESDADTEGSPRLVLVEQYRPRLRARLLECPGGTVDAGESAIDAARRELREETGFRAETLEVVCANAPSVWTRMENVVVFATDLVDVGAAPEPGEVIEVRQLPVEAAFDRTREEPMDGQTRLALLEARDRGYL